MATQAKLFAVSAHIDRENEDRSRSIHQLPSFIISDVHAQDSRDATRIALAILTDRPGGPDPRNTYVLDVVEL